MSEARTTDWTLERVKELVWEATGPTANIRIQPKVLWYVLQQMPECWRIKTSFLSGLKFPKEMVEMVSEVTNQLIQESKIELVPIKSDRTGVWDYGIKRRTI